jgi:hypothetical protein
MQTLKGGPVAAFLLPVFFEKALIFWLFPSIRGA